MKRITKGNFAQICENSQVNDRLLINGTVRKISKSNLCGEPVFALLEVWHADAEGVYSNTSPLSNDFVKNLPVMLVKQ